MILGSSKLSKVVKSLANSSSWPCKYAIIKVVCVKLSPIVVTTGLLFHIKEVKELHQLGHFDLQKKKQMSQLLLDEFYDAAAMMASLIALFLFTN